MDQTTGSTLRQYLYAGIAVDSEIPLSLLPQRVEGDHAELLLMEAGDLDCVPDVWTDAERLVGPVADHGVIEIRKIGADYLLHFESVMKVILLAGIGTLRVHRAAGVDPATVEHLLLDQALPRILGHAGHLMLHASAVEIDQRSVCFVAPSGAGKSTLAALFSATGQHVLADDVVRVATSGERLILHAGYPSLRLWDDSAPMLRPEKILSHARMAQYSSKRVYQLAPSARSDGPRRLAAVFLLAPQDDSMTGPAIRPLSPASALMRLMSQSFALDASNRQIASRRLTAMSAFSIRARPRELVSPHDYRHQVPIVELVTRALDPG